MNLKGFLVAAIQSALNLGMATPDDVMKHVTPDVLAAHLPRPLWARLLTACVGAPRVDAALVVDTVGVPNLCEHVPSAIMWACLAEVGARSLGGTFVAAKTAPAKNGVASSPAIPVPGAKIESGPVRRPPPVPLSINAPPEIVAAPVSAAATQPSPIVHPEIPSPLGEVIEDGAAMAARGRTPTSQRFRATSTGIGRLAAGARRPQANASASAAEEATSTSTSAMSAPASASGPHARPPRRGATESEYEATTDIATSNADEDWKEAAVNVEEEQLVDWTSSEETTTGSPDVPTTPPPRKR